MSALSAKLDALERLAKLDQTDDMGQGYVTQLRAAAPWLIAAACEAERQRGQAAWWELRAERLMGEKAALEVEAEAMRPVVQAWGGLLDAWDTYCAGKGGAL